MYTGPEHNSLFLNHVVNFNPNHNYNRDFNYNHRYITTVTQNLAVNITFALSTNPYVNFKPISMQYLKQMRSLNQYKKTGTNLLCRRILAELQTSEQTTEQLTDL